MPVPNSYVEMYYLAGTLLMVCHRLETGRMASRGGIVSQHTTDCSTAIPSQEFYLRLFASSLIFFFSLFFPHLFFIRHFCFLLTIPGTAVPDITVLIMLSIAVLLFPPWSPCGFNFYWCSCQLNFCVSGFSFCRSLIGG